MRLRLAAVAAVAILLGACATIPVTERDARVIEVIDRFNTVEPSDFITQSGVPFLFNDQVLYAESDLVAILDRLREGGLVIAPRVIANDPARPASADARFDVQVFHDRLPPDARFVTVPSNAGDVTLILAGEANRLPMLVGLVRGRL